MFKSKYKGVGFGLKNIINTVTGEVDLDKIYEQNLATAMQNKNIQPKKIKEMKVRKKMMDGGQVQFSSQIGDAVATFQGNGNYKEGE